MVPTTGIAPVRPFGHSVLNTARLLFHHAGMFGASRGICTPHTFRYTGLSRARLADDGTRTHGINVGNVAQWPLCDTRVVWLLTCVTLADLSVISRVHGLLC